MKKADNQLITPEVIEDAYTYKGYKTLIDTLMAENKTTGTNHSEEMLHYTKMNVLRMNRLYKQTKIDEKLKSRLQQIEKPMVWLTITEAWCGDAAQIIPVIQKMADENSFIRAKYILRDENLEIMDQFLTNGTSRSIPKLIILDADTLNVLGNWGPRPLGAQKLYEEWREQGDSPYQEIAESLQKWYTKDKTISIQKEIGKLINDVIL